jgi:hypothetical protein
LENRSLDESHTKRGILSLGEESEGIGAEARWLWMRVAFVKLVKRALTRCFAQIDPNSQYFAQKTSSCWPDRAWLLSLDLASGMSWIYTSRWRIIDICNVGLTYLTLLLGREISDGGWLRALSWTGTTLDDAILSGWLSAISRLVVLIRTCAGWSSPRETFAFSFSATVEWSKAN